MLKLTPFFFLSFSLSYNTFKHKLFDFISAFIGERLIQFASENLVTEILIHPQYNTLIQCMRNLLSSFTRHRHIIHSGYTFSGNGSWILQVCMRAISTQFYPSPSIFLLYVLISITQLDCFVLFSSCVPHFGRLKCKIGCHVFGIGFHRSVTRLRSAACDACIPGHYIDGNSLRHDALE